jgi:hypothetical protein
MSKTPLSVRDGGFIVASSVPTYYARAGALDIPAGLTDSSGRRPLRCEF